MLIRSQERQGAVNMDMVNAIHINSNIPCMCTIEVEYEAGSVTLGMYKSRERAEEVLEEIIGCYSIHKAVEIGKRPSLEELKPYSGMKLGCYDMPAE